MMHPLLSLNRPAVASLLVLAALCLIATQLPPLVIHAQTPPPSANLILNPSLETAGSNGLPANWRSGTWGKNTVKFTYPADAQDGARGASVSITKYTNGDAKWYFDDVAVTPGVQYQFSDFYKSTTASSVLARFTSQNGAITYLPLAVRPASSNWQKFTGTITPPAGTLSLTVFHLLQSKGSLTVDTFSLTAAASSSSSPTSSSSSNVSSSSSSVSSSSSNVSSSFSTSSRSSSFSRSSLNSSSSSMGNSSSSSSQAKKLWGAHVGNQLTDAATFEALVGKKMNMQSIFVGGSDPFPSVYGLSVRDQGKTLVIFWEPTAMSLDSIIAGQHNATITAFVNGARSYGGPMIFVPFHEMNGNWVPWGGTVGTNTPAKVIAAWRHVHGLFVNVPNVKFGWAVNNGSVPNTAENSIQVYYPGAAYVDYAGVDGFNFDNPWQTFDQVFGSALQILTTYGKPVMIFSMASAQGTGKAAWITDALTTQMARHPAIVGWIWFNANKEKDWRVNSDPASLEAFKAALR